MSIDTVNSHLFILMNFAMHGPPDMLAALHSMEVAPSSSADSEDPECASDSSDSDDDLVL